MKRKPDAAWKMLFSTREIVRDLIAGFVTDAWVRMLDLDTLEKVPTHFVDRQMRQRITDVVWRVRTREGDWAHLYLLIEFQSRNDPWMARDTHRFDDAGLRPMRNLLASVMRLELNPDAPTHLEAVADLRRLVSGAPELKRAFSDWLTALLADRPDLADSGAIDLQETDMGIRENIERWQKEAIAKGRMEGLVEGRVEGRLEGQMEGRQEGETLMLQRLPNASARYPRPSSNASPQPPGSRSRSGVIGCSTPDRSTRSSRTERRSGSIPHRRNA